MSKKDTRVDAYIAKAADDAKPILQRIRVAVHAACPDAEETLKWGTPAYVYKGILCLTPAFKKHCALIFWHAELRRQLVAEFGKETVAGWRTMTNAGQLPSKTVLVRLLKAAVKVNESGVKSVRVARPKKPLETPPDFLTALRKNKTALDVFAAFPPSHRREYVQYITEAKRPETRAKRIAQSIETISEGKDHNWKYKR